MTIKVDWYAEEFQAKLHDKLGDALEDCAFEVESRAQNIVPVDTGELQESIRHETDRDILEAKVGSDVEYSGYVELGTRKMAAQPYLRPAAYELNFGQNFEGLI